MINDASWLFLLMQIFFVDLLPGEDNAVVIALACRGLPAQDAGRALALGAGAIILRLRMILFANALLVKLVGAWPLVFITLNVRSRKPDDLGIVESARSATICCPPRPSS